MNRVHAPLELPPEWEADPNIRSIGDEVVATEMRNAEVLGVEIDEVMIIRDFLRDIGCAVNDSQIPRFNSDVIKLVREGLDPNLISPAFAAKFSSSRLRDYRP